MKEKLENRLTGHINEIYIAISLGWHLMYFIKCIMYFVKSQLHLAIESNEVGIGSEK